MKRRILVTTVLLLSASFTAAQDKYGPAVPGALFTLQIPLNFQAIHPSITHVGVTCELRGYVPQGESPTGALQPLTPRTFVTRASGPMPLTQFGGKGQLPAPTPAGPGGYHYNQKLALITFVSNDFALNPAGMNDPASVTEAWCYFALHAVDGGMYHPAIDHSAVRYEIDNFRRQRGPDFIGPVALTQPAASAWPPVLSPHPKTDPLKTPYVWHQAWLFRMPKWAWESARY